MLRFIGKRILQMGFLFIIFLTILFFLLQAQPGDITAQFLDPSIPAQNRAVIQERLGLDKSLFGQYTTYITNFFKGDLGVSFSQFPRDVTDLIMERLPRTLFLFSGATLLSYWLGFVAGKFLAWRRGGGAEYGVTISGVLLYTVFYPWFAIVMIWLFAVRLDFFPTNQFLTPERWINQPFSSNEVFARVIWSVFAVSFGVLAIKLIGARQNTLRGSRAVRYGGYGVLALGFTLFWRDHVMRPFAVDLMHHAVLPIVTLALIAFAGVMLLTRASMLETLREDYILAARAKGVPDHQIRDHHAARNALLPVVTSFVLGLAFVIGGGVVTETVFSWPGMGELLLTATRVEDIPVAMGTLAFVGVLALFGHLLVDVLYVFLDPRIRVQG